ncbi:MAG: hypothetical protein KAY65_10330 [Planctomycetes bacterium]|nr:hypothetical protein [Planctomycetota bacterium]
MIATVSVLSAQKVGVTRNPPDAGNIVGYYIERADVEVWTEDQLKRLKSRVQPLPEPSAGAIGKIGPFQRLGPSLLEITSRLADF